MSITRRIAVKVGSNVLTRADGTLDITRMSALVDQLAAMRHQGIEVVLITSGAVASGRSELHLPQEAIDRMSSVEQRQLYSAVGQAKLMSRYVELFRDHGLHVGQVLTMKENFAPGEQYDNQRQCMTAMLSHGVLPIVNENDTVCVTELMFTDNDELSGLVALMLECDTLIILSNIDGIYTGLPSDPASRLIARIAPADDISPCIQASKSEHGRGGMQSKHATARRVQMAGTRVLIANGKRDEVLTRLLADPAGIPHTEFVPYCQ